MAQQAFFSVPSPEGDTPLLFAPAGATVFKHPDSGDSSTDSTRHLVTVIPKGAAVKVTDTESVTDPSDPSDGSHYADHDLRRDLLIHCHDNSDHPGLANTNLQVRSLCWFPAIGKYIQYHVDSCAYCVAKRTAATPVGVAVRTRRRLKLIEFDHKKLPPAMAAATGYAAILTVVDVVSRVTIFIPVVRLTAVATARALFTRWYPMFGVPVPAIVYCWRASRASDEFIKFILENQHCSP